MASIAETRFASGPWPWALLVTASLVVSTNHIIGRYYNGDIPPMGLAFWRVAIGALVVMPFAWCELIRQREAIARHWKLLFAMAVGLMPAGNALVYLAYHFTTAINGGIILTAQPALTILLAWIVLGYTISRRQGIGIAVAAVGVLVILLRGDETALAGLTLHSGDLIMLVGTMGFACYTVLLRKVPSSISPIVILIVVQIFGAIALAPFYLYETLTYRPVPVTTESILVLLWVGTAIAVLTVGLNNIATLALGPAKASIGHYLRALFTAVMAMALLGEALEPFHLVAFAAIIAGIVLMSRGQTPTPRIASERTGP